MLRNTFSHITGIGVRTERLLWERGIHSWEDCVAGHARLPFGRARSAAFNGEIERSMARLQAGDARYFADRLPPDQHWRLFPEFRNRIAYLDIETTGLGSPSDTITTIALYDGRSVRTYVQGKNLDEFAAHIQQYNLLVTYNGKCFDIPFIGSYLGIDLNHAHIDLRYILRSLGYTGGLKGCERQIGITREELDGVDGYFAVLLWEDYSRNNNPKALETLLAYNVLDTVNLETFLIFSYNLKIRETPFHPQLELRYPPAPAMPFRPDSTTIEQIKRRFYNRG